MMHWFFIPLYVIGQVFLLLKLFLNNYKVMDFSNIEFHFELCFKGMQTNKNTLEIQCI